MADLNYGSSKEELRLQLKDEVLKAIKEHASKGEFMSLEDMIVKQCSSQVILQTLSSFDHAVAKLMETFGQYKEQLLEAQQEDFKQFKNELLSTCDHRFLKQQRRIENAFSSTKTTETRGVSNLSLESIVGTGKKYRRSVWSSDFHIFVPVGTLSCIRLYRVGGTGSTPWSPNYDDILATDYMEVTD